MKILIVAVLSILSLNLPADILTELDHCSLSCSQYCEGLIKIAESSVERAKSGCGNSNQECFKFLLDKGYGLDTVKRACSNGANVDCVKLLVNKGFGIDTVIATCDRQTSVDCLELLLGKGYGIDSTKKACRGTTDSQTQCIKLLLDKGYGLDSAVNACKNN